METVKRFQRGCAISFFSSLFGGSDPTLNADIAKTGQIADWSTGLGEKNLTASSNFFNSILSGDATKQSQVLAPEINAAKTSANQDIKTTSEMGTRSGGTAASNAATKDKIHGYIANLLGSLTGSAATILGSMGESSLNTGLSATMDQAKLAQQRMDNWSNSILGKGITTAVSAAETMALGA